jgi:hypothetical protein
LTEINETRPLSSTFRLAARRSRVTVRNLATRECLCERATRRSSRHSSRRAATTQLRPAASPTAQPLGIDLGEFRVTYIPDGFSAGPRDSCTIPEGANASETTLDLQTDGTDIRASAPPAREDRDISIEIVSPPTTIFRSNVQNPSPDHTDRVHDKTAAVYPPSDPDIVDVTTIVWTEDRFTFRVSGAGGVPEATLLKVARGIVRTPGGAPLRACSMVSNQLPKK